MRLYWLVHDVEGERRVWIQEAYESTFARIKAAISGHEGEFVECHELDAKTAKKVPQKMVGRVLSPAE